MSTIETIESELRAYVAAVQNHAAAVDAELKAEIALLHARIDRMLFASSLPESQPAPAAPAALSTTGESEVKP